MFRAVGQRENSCFCIRRLRIHFFEGAIQLSKFMRAWLTQGKKKYDGILSVDMTIKKAMSISVLSRDCDIWKIELEIGRGKELSDDWKLNQMFNLFVEYSAEDKNPVIETISGEILIQKFKFYEQKPCLIKGTSIDLKFSSKDRFIKEKVQFD